MKNYLTDNFDIKGILRLIESVSSPKAKVFCTECYDSFNSF